MDTGQVMLIDITLRAAQLSDEAALYAACFSNRPPDWFAAFFASSLNLAAQGRSYAVVAVAGQQLLGFGQLCKWQQSAEIADLVVNEAYRGQGIGTAIILHLMAQAAAWRYSQVEIGVAEGNPRAHALYLRLGFQQIRRLYIDLGAGEEPVLYLSQPIGPA
jgi:ribosomal protein S18 acetylase RimI-like enzyme